MLNIGKLLLIPGVFLFSASSHAVGLVLEMGLHTGGDELVTANFTSGDSETLKAGGLYHFSIGAGFDIGDYVESRITAGIKQTTITASNGDISFTRYPIDAVFFYKLESWRLGGGLTYHTNVKLDSSGLSPPLTADFDNALGLLLEVDFYMGEKAYIGGRYTVIEYDTVPSDTVKAATVDGNSIGIILGLRF